MRLLIEFLEEMENVLEHQRSLVLDATLKGTLARWWATHKAAVESWEVVIEM